MFELEVDYNVRIAKQIPKDIVEEFSINGFIPEKDSAVSLLMWEEHCTECAMPACYSTCDMYLSRKDGKCRRFENGIVPIDISPEQRIVRIDYKPWGSLMSSARVAMIKVERYRQLDRFVGRIEKIARLFPDGGLSLLGRKGVSSRLARRYKKHIVASESVDIETYQPDCFILEVYNPHDNALDLTLVIRAESGSKNSMPYQKRILANKKYNRITIDASEILQHVDPSRRHFISITPNRADGDHSIVTAYFGFLGFVSGSQNPGKEKHKTVKVIAWDLDNTLWEGVLVEDGPDNIKMKEGVADVVKELDRRGIVNTILSKNDHDNAISVLEKTGLSEYFVFPQINWEPKSHNMKKIIADFNVGENTVAFIDDSPFEKEEVSSQFKSVRIYDASEYRDLLSRPEFTPEVSSESAKRRQFYINQGKRASVLNEFQGDYTEFLKGCDINMKITHADISTLDRTHELVQRTNQMNFSGRRYNKEQLAGLMQNPDYETFNLNCYDAFGDYGTVGFCVVDIRNATVIDLAFSCRIQSKLVEHTLFVWLLQRYIKNDGDELKVVYVKTERNAAVSKVFSDLNFTQELVKENRFLYSASADSIVGFESPITVHYEGEKQ